MRAGDLYRGVNPTGAGENSTILFNEKEKTGEWQSGWEKGGE